MPVKSAKTLRANHEAIAKHVRGQKDQPRDEWRIAGEKGLVLITFPTGSASWYSFYRPKGRPQRKLFLGDYGGTNGMSLADAKAANDGVRASVRQGVDPKQAMKAGETFKTVAEKALADNVKWSKSTKRNYGYALRNDVFPVIGNLPINTVTKDDCLRVLAKIKARKKMRQAENVRRIMSAVFGWAKNENYTTANPVEDIPVQAKPTERKRAPKPEELRTVWNALDKGQVSQQVRLVIRLTILLGMRRTEVAGLRCDERHGDKLIIAADVEKTGFIVEEGRMKNGRQQTIYLSRQAQSILDEAMKTCSDGTYFFPANPMRTKGSLKTAHVNPGSITTRMWTLSRALGFGASLAIHDMRRAITDWMEEENLSASVQDTILHHTPQDTRSKNYLDQDGERRDRMKKLEQRLRDTWQAWADYVEGVVTAAPTQEPENTDDQVAAA